MISDKDKDKILNHGRSEVDRRALVKKTAEGIAWFILFMLAVFFISMVFLFSMWMGESYQKRIIKEAIIEAEKERKP